MNIKDNADRLAADGISEELHPIRIGGQYPGFDDIIRSLPLTVGIWEILNETVRVHLLDLARHWGDWVDAEVFDWVRRRAGRMASRLGITHV